MVRRVLEELCEDRGATPHLSMNGTNFRMLYLFQPTNRRCKNVAARTNNIASGENPDFIDHCGRSILYGSYGGKD